MTPNFVESRHKNKNNSSAEKGVWHQPPMQTPVFPWCIAIRDPVESGEAEPAEHFIFILL